MRRNNEYIYCSEGTTHVKYCNILTQVVFIHCYTQLSRQTHRQVLPVCAAECSSSVTHVAVSASLSAAASARTAALAGSRSSSAVQSELCECLQAPPPPCGSNTARQDTPVRGSHLSINSLSELLLTFSLGGVATCLVSLCSTSLCLFLVSSSCQLVSSSCRRRLPALQLFSSSSRSSSASRRSLCRP